MIRSPGQRTDRPALDGFEPGGAHPLVPQVGVERPHAGNPKWLRNYQLGIFITDIVLITLVVVASIQLRWGFDRASLASGVTWAGSAAVAGIIGLLWAVALMVNGAWDRKILGAGTSEYRRIFNASCGLFLLLITSSYVLRADLARGYVAILFPLGICALTFGRILARARLRAKRRTNENMSNVLIIGSETSAASLASLLSRSPNEGLRVTGVCVPIRRDEESPNGAGFNAVRAGELDQIRSAISQAEAHLVAIAPSTHFGPSEVRALAWDLEGTGIGLALAPALTDVAGPRVHIKPVSGLPLMYVEEPRFRGPKLLIKTGMDWFGALAMLMIFAPVILFVAALIKFEGGGPVLFRQERVGLDGQHFNIIKFRSMRPHTHDGVDRDGGSVAGNANVFYKSPNDDRITRVGRVLRLSSLDELPQLFNVLSGKMSLVGPRPLVPGEGAGVHSYLERRMLVKPGLTGLWQVSGRSDAAEDERVRLDLYYVENWSIAGDLVILARTVRSVLTRHGAY